MELYPIFFLPSDHLFKFQQGIRIAGPGPDDPNPDLTLNRNPDPDPDWNPSQKPVWTRPNNVHASIYEGFCNWIGLNPDPTV